ncbi:hypothetical protein DICVIV_09959 [Dictyocaulus viviparus]|uniref:Transthyretin-like family protein n=1 Tax=Dictyocaulus viviparus TaxID=29172 RepID=A0A0D8XJL5_DICVI|nr:hypothetical protein DICVIV_09959 [Dictyocaulus viviparus]
MQILGLSGIGINLMWICFITISLHGSVDSEGGTADLGYTLSRCPEYEFGEDLAVYDILILSRLNRSNLDVGRMLSIAPLKGRRSNNGLRTTFIGVEPRYAEGEIIVFICIFTDAKQRVNDNPEYMEFVYGKHRKLWDIAKSGTGLDFGNFYNRNPISIESVSVEFTALNKTCL